MSLGEGLAGLALTHAVLDPWIPGVGHQERARSALSRAIDRIARDPTSPSLFMGFVGVSWVAEVVTNARVSTQDLNADIDRALQAWLSRSPWASPYDLIEGIVGIGVYALERMPRDGARGLLELAVERLAGLAVRKKGGIAWHSDPRWLPPELADAPRIEWNLGVAHGAPGIVGFLAQACIADVAPAAQRTARRLLDGAVRWILSHEGRGEASAFAWAADETAREPARLAWCYGDAGIAASLLLAARAVEEPAWERAAIRIALGAARRSHRSSGVADAGLCHGSGGLGHLFHRLYRMTGMTEFAAAARRWYRVTFDHAGARGSGGRPSAADRQLSRSWTASPGFLSGSGGVAVAIAAALADGAAPWNRVMLIP
ncbi:MAG TPA: lanthionine synthetase C family protein [Kofleriaceae bacterium]|nr:lanthionine synthetase C family protein [Kofleriaceae bacterium]